MIAFIQRYAIYGLGAVILALGIYAGIQKLDAAHWHKQYDQELAAHQLDNARVATASAQATANNVTDVRAKESDAAAITEKANHDLESELADARRLAADYARRVRAASAAYPGGSGQAGIGETAGTSDSLGRAGGVPLLDEDDVRVCSEAVIKSRGWQDWYAALRARYNLTIRGEQ